MEPEVQSNQSSPSPIPPSPIPLEICHIDPIVFRQFLSVASDPAGGPHANLRDMVKEYFRMGKQDLKRMQTGGDDTKSLAHSWALRAAQFGFKGTARAAYDLERACCCARDWQEVRVRVGELAVCFKQDELYVKKHHGWLME